MARRRMCSVFPETADKKVQAISALLKELDSISCKYVIRIILGTMRLGFSDITAIEAISWSLGGDKSQKK